MYLYTDIKKTFDIISTNNVKRICGDDIEDPNKLLDKTKFILEITNNIKLFPEKIAYTTANFSGKAYSSLTIAKYKPKKQTNTIKAITIDFFLQTYQYKNEHTNQLETISYGPHYITLTPEYIRLVHDETFNNFPSKLKKINTRSLQESIMLMKTEIEKKILIENI